MYVFETVSITVNCLVFQIIKNRWCLKIFDVKCHNKNSKELRHRMSSGESPAVNTILFRRVKICCPLLPFVQPQIDRIFLLFCLLSLKREVLATVNPEKCHVEKNTIVLSPRVNSTYKKLHVNLVYHKLYISITE